MVDGCCVMHLTHVGAAGSHAWRADSKRMPFREARVRGNGECELEMVIRAQGEAGWGGRSGQCAVLVLAFAVAFGSPGG